MIMPHLVPFLYARFQKAVWRANFFHMAKQRIRVFWEAVSSITKPPIVTGYLRVHWINPLITKHKIFHSIKLHTVPLTDEVELVKILDLYRVKRITKNLHRLRLCCRAIHDNCLWIERLIEHINKSNLFLCATLIT